MDPNNLDTNMIVTVQCILDMINIDIAYPKFLVAQN